MDQSDDYLSLRAWRSGNDVKSSLAAQTYRSFLNSCICVCVLIAGDRGEQGDKGAKGYGLPGNTGDPGPKGTFNFFFN